MNDRITARRVGVIGADTAQLCIAVMDGERARVWAGATRPPLADAGLVCIDLGDAAPASVFTTEDGTIVIVEGFDTVPPSIVLPDPKKSLRLRGKLESANGTLVLCDMFRRCVLPKKLKATTTLSSGVAITLPAGTYEVFSDHTPVEFPAHEANGEQYVRSYLLARIAPTGRIHKPARRVSAPVRPTTSRAAAKPKAEVSSEGLAALIGTRRPSSVVKLDLTRKNLHALPDLSTLTGLRDLRLTANPLEKLPRSLWKLANLEKLDLRYLPISELSEDIGALTKLKHLALCGTKLKTLPAALWKLDLTELRMSEVPIRDLSADIANLSRLTLLWINKTALACVPPQLASLRRLSTLRVSAGLPGLDQFKRQRPTCLVQEQ